MTQLAKPQHIYLTFTTDEFKEQCLEIIAELSKCGGVVIIFDGDEPIVQLTQYEEVHDPVRGSFKGRMEILGDIVSPMPAEWYSTPAESGEQLP